jgi:hypothetical protein
MMPPVPVPLLPPFPVLPDPLLQAAAKSAQEKVATRFVFAVIKDSPPLVPEL